MILFLLAILLTTPLSAATIDTATASQPLETTRQQKVADLKERSASLLKAYPDLLSDSGFWPLATYAFETTDRDLLGAQKKISAPAWPLARSIGAGMVDDILKMNTFYRTTVGRFTDPCISFYRVAQVSALPKLPYRILAMYVAADLAVSLAGNLFDKQQSSNALALGNPYAFNPPSAGNMSGRRAAWVFGWAIWGGIIYHRSQLNQKYRQQAHQLLGEIDKQQREKTQSQLISGNSQ
jgi:hypothetical protein